MGFDIYRTTAEHVVGAADACLQVSQGIDANLAASFLDTPIDNAKHALLMASQLTLVREDPPGLFVAASPCVSYLCTSSREDKAAILRFLLEQYEPYRVFKARLAQTGVVGVAATQTKALLQMQAHRDVISETFISLGTYARSLHSEAGGLYNPREGNPTEFLRVLDNVIQDRAGAEMQVLRRLGSTAHNWISDQSVFRHLVTAYQRAAPSAIEDPRAAVLHAANAIESFLTQLANDKNLNVQNCHGINAKADALGREGQITKKHKHILKYLGHVRNAADHGIDNEIGKEWTISNHTAQEYVHVAQTAIRSILLHTLETSYEI